MELEVIYTVFKEAGYEVTLFDAIRPKDKTLEDIVEEIEPTITYTNGVVKQVPIMLEYCQRIKKYCNSIKTIVGGSYAEHNYESLYTPDLDYICRSYDPYVVLEVAKYLEGSRSNLDNLNGLCYKENNIWKHNSIRPFDINQLPITDRTYFYNNIEEFSYLDMRPAAQVRTSYSCPYHCKFCYRTSLNCGTYVTKEMDKVVEEIKGIQCDVIYFVDDDFLFQRERLQKFIDLVKEQGIHKKYICYGRTDFILKNKDIMMQLKDIGFCYILVGLEAVSDSYLSEYNKHVGAEHNRECVEFLNQIQLRCMGMMIADLGFTRKDFRSLYRWIKETKLKHVAISIFTPLPGSDLYEEYKDKLITQDLTKWDYVHLVVKPTKISVKAYYFYYYILVFRLFNLAKKYGIYDFMDWKKMKKDFFSLLWKHE